MIANIFLHYGFDTWMAREYPGVGFERAGRHDEFYRSWWRCSRASPSGLWPSERWDHTIDTARSVLRRYEELAAADRTRFARMVAEVSCPDHGTIPTSSDRFHTIEAACLQTFGIVTVSA